MSTVGYGDVYCQTVLGRTFLVFFLLVGLVSHILFYIFLSIQVIFVAMFVKVLNVDFSFYFKTLIFFIISTTTPYILFYLVFIYFF